MKYSQELLDKYRDINVDFGDWSDSVIENFKERVLEYGIDCERVYYTGFYSQGDGACFDGYVRDQQKFLDTLTNNDQQVYTGIRALLKSGECDAFLSSWSRLGQHNHEYCLHHTLDFDGLENNLPWGAPEFLEEVAETLDLKADKELDELEDSIREFVRDLCKELYKELENAYEFLTSDEMVAEAIEANDLVESV